MLQELRALANRLRVDELLTGWGTAAQWLDNNAHPKAALFLLTLDSERRRVHVKSYGKGAETAANRDYANAEKENQEHTQIQTVLVSVDSLAALKSAYPNYYLDTSAFVSALKSILR